MNGIIEMMTANKWLIEPTFGLKAMRLLNAMAAGHLQNEKEKVYGARFYSMTDGSFAAYADDDDERGSEKSINEPFINVLHLEGPLTRMGGACTYGSRQLRDLMMEAADMKGCLGHLLLINGPGGVSNAIPDLQQATDYARAKGQPIVGRIDGYCASAHCWVSAMCDEVYYNSPTDQIGSIGVYWAGILNKDGDIDPQTGGKMHVVYDPESYDKNRTARELAENDDDTLIKEELKQDGEAFRNYIKSRRPNVKDEHLHGKMFEAKDVEGIFVVGQATMQETFKRIVELKGARTAGKGGGRATTYGTDGVRMDAGAAKENILSNHNNSINMKEKFPAVFALLGIETMECTEEGTFFNASLLETLNGKIEAMQQEAAQAKKLAESLTQEKTAIESQLTEKDTQIAALTDEKAALETAVAEKDAAIDAAAQAAAKAAQDMEAEHKAAIDQLTADHAAAITAKDAELNGIKASLTTAENTLAERDQTISDLNAQIEELQNEPGEGAQVEGPATNGTSAEQPGIAISSQYVYDHNKPYDENMKAKAEWEKEHGK